MILGIDFETTGVDPKTDRAIEIGAVLFSESFEEFKTFNAFIYDESIGVIPDEIEKITNISMSHLRQFGKPFGRVLQELQTDFLYEKDISAVIAHNAPFDRGILEAEIQRHHVGYVTNLPALPWICSMSDLKSNRAKKCKKLSHLALDYGVVVDPSILHRAVADVQLMGKMLRGAGASYIDMLRSAMTPTVVVQAMVPSPFGPKGDGGRGKDLAKKHGYRWQSPGEGIEREWEKSWVKALKEDEVDQEKQSVPFPINVHTIVKN